MSTGELDEADLEVRFRSAVATDLDLLAAMHDRELDAEMLNTLRQTGFPATLGLDLASSTAAPAVEAMSAALDALCVPPTASAADDLAAQYADVYLTHGFGVSPSESPWVDRDGLTRQQPALEVRSWYRRHGLVVRDRRPDDHVVHQLGFVAHLLREGHGDDTLAEAVRFIDAHLLRWLPQFTARLAGHMGPPVYVGLGVLTVEYLRELREVLTELVGADVINAPPPPDLAKACQACPA